MENSINGCPTEILIDLKEDDFVPSYCKNINTNSHTQEPMKSVQNNGHNYELKQEKYQCIMDMSPFKLKNACNKPDVNSLAKSEQILDRAEDDCPTGLLIDLPNSSRTCPKEHSLLECNKRDSHQEETLVKDKSLIQGKESNCTEENKSSALEDSGNPCSLIPVTNELSLPRFRWKIPSPQSMSRISKEASKIIHDLNSSFLEDDTLLCDEILPIPINFDLDENSDDETSKTNTENGSLDNLSNQKTSICIQTELDVNSTELSQIALDSSSSVIKDACISPKYNTLARSSSDIFDSKIKGKGTDKCTTAEELKSAEIQSSSFDDSEIFSSNDETNDVFTENNMPSEDKENIQERKDKFLPSKAIIRGKAIQKNSVSVKKVEERPTLKNLSNIKNVNSRYLPSVNKTNSTVNNFLPNSKQLQFQGKQQLKKTISVEPQMLKGISRSNSFQTDRRRESIFSFPQPKSNKQKPSLLSEYKSSSSDVRPSFTPLKTPNKRYSIATPLQSTSIKKCTLTPALSKIQNPSVSRFTPQSAGGRRLSFSKSWQPSDRSNSKGFKNQNTSIHTSAVERPSFCGAYSSKPNKQVLNKSISLLSSQMSRDALSTTSKKRFTSKLNLPSSFPAEQDRKLARVLFPSIPSK